MFFILLVLTLVGFLISLLLHVKTVLCLLPEPERPQHDGILKWAGLHLGLIAANVLALTLEGAWSGANAASFWRSFWAFLPDWVKWTVAVFVIYLLAIAGLETNRFNTSAGKCRIYQQDGRYWMQEVYIARRIAEDRQILEEIDLEPVEISRGRYLRLMGYADGLFPGLWAFNYFLLVLYFWYKSQWGGG